MNIFERQVGGRRYRIASQSVWDPAKQRPFARQAVLGSADPPPVADLGSTLAIGTLLVGDVGALLWVAEQLDLIKLIDQACGLRAPRNGPTVGEMVVAVAVQRACGPGAKCHLAAFLESCVPRCRASASVVHALTRLRAHQFDAVGPESLLTPFCPIRGRTVICLGNGFLDGIGFNGSGQFSYLICDDLECHFRLLLYRVTSLSNDFRNPATSTSLSHDRCGAPG